MPKKRIYLDYAATTPLDKEVLREMLPYFSQKFGNAMSLHSFGREAATAVEKARKQVADFFGASPEEIIFTSGATESNNLAIKGVVKAYHDQASNNICPHIITTSFEHHCVLNICKVLEKEGKAEITFLPVYKEGIVKVEDIKKAIKPNTILISIMYVNNEIGTVQPIAEIGKLLKQSKSKTLFHTDATQAVNYFNCDVNKLNVDLLSMSAHKIYGPKGAGALYIRKGINIARIQDGGEQENNLRAGTHNVAGIIGLGQALTGIKDQELGIRNKEVSSLKDYLVRRVLKEVPNSKLNGSKIKRSPNNANFSFRGVEGESLVLMLDEAGIAVSTGSACSSKSLKPSHVLLAIGQKSEEAHGSVRMTLGKYATKQEIDYTVDKLKEIIGKLRGVSGEILKEYHNKKS